ncbi:MAG: hypothetical protein ABIC95_04630 [archaeon]
MANKAKKPSDSKSVPVRAMLSPSFRLALTSIVVIVAVVALASVQFSPRGGFISDVDLAAMRHIDSRFDEQLSARSSLDRCEILQSQAERAANQATYMLKRYEESGDDRFLAAAERLASGAHQVWERKDQVCGEKEMDCRDYTYSNCPSGCQRRCISSACPPGGPCTDDCEGPGSCY